MIHQGRIVNLLLTSSALFQRQQLSCFGLLTQAHSLLIKILRFAVVSEIRVRFWMQQTCLRRGCTSEEGHCEGGLGSGL